MSDVTTILVDVEAVGGSPRSGEMTEFGAVALNTSMTAITDTFHGVLIEAVPDRSNPAIPHIPDGATRYDLPAVMAEFDAWLDRICGGTRAVFVSDNPLYDGMWIWDAFDQAGIRNPFGHSGRRIADFAAGLAGDWRKTQQWKQLRRTKHTHHPVDDATGNAEALIELIARTGNNTATTPTSKGAIP